MKRRSINVAGACVLCVCASAVAGGLLYAAPRKSPTGPQCDSLYRKQLSLFQKEDSPLFPVLVQKKAALLLADSMRVQRDYCRANVSGESFRCQMRAASLAELLGCTGSPSVTQPGKGTGSGEPPETGSEKTEIVVVRPNVRALVRSVSQDTCDQAYAHMLSVHSSAPAFQKRPDAKRLMEHWQSVGARESFRRRCIKGFQVADLNCILSAKEPESLQACLISVGG